MSGGLEGAGAAGRVVLADVVEAARRMREHIHMTPVIMSRSLDEASEKAVVLKCENLQRTGSFKIRGALNAVVRLPSESASRGAATASSGNFAQGLAWAARLRGIPAHVVMPSDAGVVKRAAVEALGAVVYLCEPTLTSRDEVCADVLRRSGATFISPHDAPDVIAGQGTVALELLAQADEIDAVLVPVGGGGLIAGVAAVVKALRPQTRVVGAEPIGAADAARSKAAGTLEHDPNPQSVAKGLLIGLGDITWPIVDELVDEIVVVDEDAIVSAMRFVWERVKLIIEPSAAVAVAALLSPQFRRRGDVTRVAVVLTGGNVDLDILPWQEALSLAAP